MRLGIVGLVIVLALGGCSSEGDGNGAPGAGQGDPSAEASDRVEAGANLPGSLTLSPGRPTGTVLTNDGQFTVSGDTQLRVVVASLSEGELKVAAGPDKSLPTALTFPAYRPSGAYPRAVLSLTPTAGQALSPGDADFEYGAVFRLDGTSSGRVDDNGDNVFQRGLSGDPSMLKLEVDHGRPSCKVQGAAGEVIVRSKDKITADEWYEVRCSRVGDEVTVSVAPYGSEPAVPRSASGPTGDIEFTPLQRASVGGKLTKSGAIVTKASDQFNGAIAKVWIDRAPTTSQSEPTDDS